MISEKANRGKNYTHNSAYSAVHSHLQDTAQTGELLASLIDFLHRNNIMDTQDVVSMLGKKFTIAPNKDDIHENNSSQNV